MTAIREEYQIPVPANVSKEVQDAFTVLNDHLLSITQVLAKIQGLDDLTPEFVNTIDMSGYSIINVAEAVEGTDVPQLSQVYTLGDLASYIFGTIKQITVTDNGDNTITLSLPQNIALTSSPTFAGLTSNGTILIKSSGKLGIGVTSPSAKGDIVVADTENVPGLEVHQNDVTNNPTAVIINNTGTGDSLVINTSDVVIDDSGNVGIGSATPDSKLHIVGSGHVTVDMDIDGDLNVDGSSVVDVNSTVHGVRNQKYYAEAYLNSTTSVPIYTVNVWHPALGMLQGEASDFIFDAGEAGTITSIAQNGSDITITANNTLSVGDPVALVGGTGYDGLYMVTAATATDFDVTATYVATGTGTYIKGDNVTVPVDGIYDFTGWFSGNGLTGSATFEFDMVVDDALVDKGMPSRKFANTTDRGNMCGGFFVSLIAGEKLSFVARNITNTNNFQVAGQNLRIRRI